MRTLFRSRAHIFVLAIGLSLLTSPVTHRTEAAVTMTPINKTDLSSITEALVDSAVEVEATVKSVTPPRDGANGPFRIELSDGTGTMTLVVWPDVFQVIKAQSQLEVGTVVYVNAKVEKYREHLQLNIQSATNLTVVGKTETAAPPAEKTPAAPPAPPAPEAGALTPVANITRALMNQYVTVQASITDIREPRSKEAPYIVTLAQDNSRISLTIWSSVQQSIKRQLNVGNVVRVKAQVTEYRGALQIRLRYAADFTVVNAPAPAQR